MPPPTLPPLREELSLHAGPTAPDGAPTWTLRDPVRNSFFGIDWSAFEIMARWTAGSPASIQRAVQAETALQIDEHDIEELADFLAANQLLRPTSRLDSARLSRLAASKQRSWAEWLLHHYLFIRVPLLRPDRFLDHTVALIGWLYTKTFAWVTIAVLLAGLFLVHQQWDSFRTTLVDTFTVQGAVYYALALSVVKTIHEFGHAYTAKRMGCRVPTMGIALLVLWPVLYTDVNEAWTLARRRDRLSVGAAGIIAELTVAAWATAAWGILPDGPARQMAFVLAALTWISSLAVNCSPFMRFDGYFLLMDAVNMPNLHGRCFAMARWWLRERLFGLGEGPPEPCGPTRRRLLIAFAFAVWAYRLVLFLGIAALVYHFFVKVVGIGLFCVEIGWFVVMPIVHELQQWHIRRQPILGGVRVRWTAAVIAFLALATIVPWHSRIAAPAMLKADGNTGIYVPAGARLVDQAVREGQTVTAGQTLFVFNSPDEAAQRSMINSRINTLRYKSQSVFYDAAFREQASVIRDQLATALTERNSLDTETAQLVVTAASSGTLVDVAPALHPGDWISPKERLATIRGDTGPVIDTYVNESDLNRISIGDTANFYADAAGRQAVPCSVQFIDRGATLLLADPELASSYGGPIAVRGRKTGLVPDGALYRVRLVPQDRTIPRVQLRGVVRIAGQSQSLLARTARSIAGVVVRKSGL